MWQPVLRHPRVWCSVLTPPHCSLCAAPACSVLGLWVHTNPEKLQCRVVTPPKQTANMSTRQCTTCDCACVFALRNVTGPVTTKRNSLTTSYNMCGCGVAAPPVPVAVVCRDSNLQRVCKRLAWVPDSATAEATAARLATWFPKGEWSDTAQAVIGFGQLVCTPKKPKCVFCPLRFTCRYEQRRQLQQRGGATKSSS